MLFIVLTGNIDLEFLKMTENFYFLHIPKTAGTSLRQWLEDSRRFSVCPDGLWSQILSRPTEELSRYNMFFGHFYRYFPSYLNRPLNCITFLRNPIDRAISHYEHIRREKNHYLHKKAMVQGSLLNFLRDPETRMMIENFQVRSLSLILDTTKFQSLSLELGGELNGLERHLETVRSGLTDGAALMLAKDFLSRAVFVGLTEYMDISVRRMADVLGISSANIPKQLNANPTQSSVYNLTPMETNELAEALVLDWELYEFALQKFQSPDAGGI